MYLSILYYYLEPWMLGLSCCSDNTCLSCFATKRTRENNHVDKRIRSCYELIPIITLSALSASPCDFLKTKESKVPGLTVGHFIQLRRLYPSDEHKHSYKKHK